MLPTVSRRSIDSREMIRDSHLSFSIHNKETLLSKGENHMTIEVTLHVEVPEWILKPLNSASTSEDIISVLKSTGVAEEITGVDDTIVNAKII